ncbi:beta-glucosidase-like glycosyl hydrolase/CubicO group peptidase (beta-lactamase class C family) [Hymenobacter luteus]|uniref:beta-N-acetylhexosaminidase n=2 Tax=Hymenobacter TaxID=89966 RepID=A0A7W9WAC2_9BACT|nr:MULTISPECIES: glycoside hydrolase family 3 N-terminal domain-containing protein [Hymenobacter]MBB4600489.1 beta-glucosidase-like glycosyl hydrolase/CubicO group peptidase (beta-lactamase class C family) [Hymenobacter latericoloratus]MBB6057201.1 beta-glucosidase-like glycosyl hydrolase/CubicO group peptidase (beta-lactamase class C family) [Hymenobacter luteus]
MSFTRSLPFLWLLLALLSPFDGSAQRRKKKPSAKKTTATARRASAPQAAGTAKPLAANKPTPAKSRNLPVPFAGQLGQSRWVDSVMKTLTPDQRVAQLFMVAAYSNRKRIDEDSVSALIQQYGIGGLIFFQGGPVRQSKLLNRYQSQSKVPLLVAMDAEWGVGMRLDSVQRFPYQMSMGGIRENQLVYDMGTEVAAQFKRLGMHVNFAPVVDVNNNAQNPVIGYRSWGENREGVTEKSYLYMKGMQDAGVLAVAKHFPGHGDTDTDSHLALPLLRIDKKRIDTLELYPFKSLIKRGIGGMMVAHLNIPALDTTGLPSTLSKPIIQGLLQQKLGFEGIIFTDAMNMKGVISKYPPGDADLRALLAGNDILEFSKNIPLALKMVREAINKGQLSQADLDARCRKVLALKEWAGLNKYKPIELRNLIQDLNTPHAQYLSQRLTELSVTVLRNQRSLLPLQRLDTLRLATLTIGTKDTTDFQRMVADYAPVRHFWLPAAPSMDELTRMRETLKPYNLVLVGLNNLGRLPATNFGIAPETNVLLRELGGKGQKLVVTVFGSAYAVAKVRDLDRADAVVLAYQESKNAQDVAAEVIFGGVSASGKLPVTVSDRYGYGAGLATKGGIRLRYSFPEAVGMNNNLEARVDSIMNGAVGAQAFPGGEVLIARRGVVVLRKSYGTHSYPSAAGQAARPVRNTDLYDLASVTKVAAALPALMKLQDEGKFNPDMTLGQLFPEFKGTNKESLKLRDVLTHQARLKAWIPFWKDYTEPRGLFNSLFGKSPDAKDVSATQPAEMSRRYFRPDSSARFPLPAGPRLWARQDFPERITKAIAESPLNEKPGYVYSDLSFIMYPRFIKAASGKTIDQFVTDELYRPLGATTLGYNPTRRFPLSRITPTEYDSLFRHAQLHGTVHDEGAALLGGLSGHAGLFGNANDLAKLVQLYAWNGTYGGQQLLKPETLAEYTKCQFCPDNRRALGFDRPAANPTVNSANSVSQLSYGHTGFTGTYFWVDPKEELTCIVLTNRVNPTRRNNKITERSVRSGVLQVALESIQQARKQAVESTVPQEQ